MLKLLVTDLDGTLLKIGNELSAGISDENREALTAFVNEGGHVAIASSRGAGIHKDEIAVVGDNENDLSMFKVIPLSYCIDHAAPAIQAQASCSVATVAQALALARKAAE